MDQSIRTAAIVALVASVPVVIVFLAAIIRGYEIHILFRRPPK